MNRIIGSICLVAGTAMGAGMIALPMVMSKLGLLNSVLLMFGTWFVMYISSLINLELNLRAGKGMALGDLSYHFSGPIARIIGDTSLGLLTYSLLSAYIYGTLSILSELLGSLFSIKLDFSSLSFVFIIVFFITLLSKIKWIDYINRFFFLSMLLLFGLLIISMSFSVDLNALPILEDQATALSSWIICLPVLFTAFGFQVIFHTITNYLDKDIEALKKAFFWGSLSPALIYILWVIAVLGILYKHDPAFYEKTVISTVEVGELIKALSNITHWASIKIFYWAVSLLAIITSAIGVAIGLIDAWRQKLETIPTLNKPTIKLISVFMAVLPAYLVATLVPNAFIHALSFAGMVLTVIAIFLPVYLLVKATEVKKYFYPLLKSKILLGLVFTFGVIILIAEILNLQS
jgi:tyrosine-specific transport protein